MKVVISLNKTIKDQDLYDENGKKKIKPEDRFKSDDDKSNKDGENELDFKVSKL